MMLAETENAGHLANRFLKRTGSQPAIDYVEGALAA
jgi:hypothetical protein